MTGGEGGGGEGGGGGVFGGLRLDAGGGHVEGVDDNVSQGGCDASA